MIELTGHTGLVVALAYSPDGRILASASADGTARLWDVASGRLRTKLQSPEERATCVAFSPDGKTLAVGYGGLRGYMQVWDIPGERLIEGWAPHGVRTNSVTFHPSGRILATAGDSPEWRLRELVARVGSRALDIRNPGRKSRLAKSAAFTHDGGLFAALYARPALVEVFGQRQPGNWRSLRRINSFQWSESWGHAFCFSPDDQTMAVGMELDVSVWTMAAGRAPVTWTAHDAAVLGVAFTRDGETLLTGGADGLVKLWDRDGRLKHSFDWKIGDVGAVAFAPDGLTAAAGGFEKILIWDVERA
jgi:WD40 repeat protein